MHFFQVLFCFFYHVYFKSKYISSVLFQFKTLKNYLIKNLKIFSQNFSRVCNYIRLLTNNKHTIRISHTQRCILLEAYLQLFFYWWRRWLGRTDKIKFWLPFIFLSKLWKNTTMKFRIQIKTKQTCFLSNPPKQEVINILRLRYSTTLRI